MTRPLPALEANPRPPRLSPLRLAALAVIVLSVPLVLAFGSRFGKDPRLVASPLIGRPAPLLILPSLEDEQEVSFPIAGEVAVINFWASWCVPCRAEHPELVATARAFATRGVAFFGIVYQDRPESAISFLNELGWGENYTYLVDPDSRAAIAFGVFGVPETFFVDQSGIIVAKISGQTDALILGTTLEQVLAGDQPGDRTLGTVQSSPGR